MNAREQILGRLKAISMTDPISTYDDGLKHRLDAAWDGSFPDESRRLAGLFADALEAVSGEFYSAASVEEAAEIVGRIAHSSDYNAIVVDGGDMADNIALRVTDTLQVIAIPEAAQRSEVLADIHCSMVEAHWGVAETASLAFPYIHAVSTQPHFLAETVIAILKRDRLLAHLGALFNHLSPEEMKNLVLVTGPSRTADIEKILILGAHGPKRLIVILLD